MKSDIKPDGGFTLAAMLVLAFCVVPLAGQQSRPASPADANVPPPPLGALAPANLAKPRPQPPFDLTGTWFIDQRNSENTWRFNPTGPFKLTPSAQMQYDAAKKAQAEGKVYRDDIGQCWPAGLPIIMTRVWPIAMIQLPTMVVMIQELMNTMRFVNDHHWIDSGIPATDALHIVERIKLINDGKTLEIAMTANDPKSWEGEWKW